MRGYRDGYFGNRWRLAAVLVVLVVAGCSSGGFSGPVVDITVGAEETGPFEFDAEVGDTVIVEVENVEGPSSFLDMDGPDGEPVIQQPITDELREVIQVEHDGTFDGNFVSNGEGRLTIEVRD